MNNYTIENIICNHKREYTNSNLIFKRVLVVHFLRNIIKETDRTLNILNVEFNAVREVKLES